MNSGGTEVGASGGLAGDTISSAAVRVQVSAVIQMSVDDYVVVQGYQNSGKDLAVTTASWFSMHKI
jgi:hypothetical protein